VGHNKGQGKNMTTLTITEHMTFDLETQLQLDRMWESWSRYDAVCAEAGYENDRYNAQADRLWAEYQTALDTAYRAHCATEAAQIVARHGDSIRRQIAQAGYHQVSRRLTAVSHQYKAVQ